MSPPPSKPWNQPVNIAANQQSQNQPTDVRFKLDSQFPTVSDGFGSPPPPLPPRPVNNFAGMTPSGYNNSFFSSSYSPYGYNTGMYGGGGGYYGGGGSPYGLINRFGYEHADSSVIRVAEQHSRQAFQFVETFVQTFTSISAMLESSLAAVYNSFRAVVGVADQFSRLKSHFQHVITTLAIFRTLKWMLRKILVLLRIKPATYAEDIWLKAVGGDGPQMATELLPGEAGSRWPNLMFFALVFGGPWLVWKLLAKVVANVEESKKWATGEDDHFVAVAQYSFIRESANEISFAANDELKLAPKHLQPAVRGWLLASRDGKEIGLVPGNLLKILGKRKGNPSATQQQLTIRSSLNNCGNKTEEGQLELEETVNLDQIFANG